MTFLLIFKKLNFGYGVGFGYGFGSGRLTDPKNLGFGLTVTDFLNRQTLLLALLRRPYPSLLATLGAGTHTHTNKHCVLYRRFNSHCPRSINAV